MANDALALIYQRNDFYKKKYHLALGAFFMGFIVIVVLVSMTLYLLQHRQHPIYFATDEVGRIIQEPPLDQPNMPIEAVQAWTREAVEAAYSYDYIGYRKELQSAQKYFTDFGWRNYMSGLTASNNLLALTQRQYVVIAEVVGPIKPIAGGILGGRYAWKFELPLLLTYLQKSGPGIPPSFQNPLKVTVIVQRQPFLQSYKGLGILQLTSELVITPTVISG